MMKKVYRYQFNSSLGRMEALESAKGLVAISFGKSARKEIARILKSDFKDFDVVSGGRENKKAEKQINRYLAGKLKKFSLKLDLRGTPFQKKVLGKVASIPYGKVKTYGAIARAIGQPEASRAVGGANGRNRLPLVIPCHRVVAMNGLGGYAGGLNVKKRLLKIEGR
jgi:O-6-methylguanine DNA methyltransferase